MDATHWAEEHGCSAGLSSIQLWNDMLGGLSRRGNSSTKGSWNATHPFALRTCKRDPEHGWLCLCSLICVYAWFTAWLECIPNKLGVTFVYRTSAVEDNDMRWVRWVVVDSVLFRAFRSRSAIGKRLCLCAEESSSAVMNHAGAASIASGCYMFCFRFGRGHGNPFPLASRTLHHAPH